MIDRNKILSRIQKLQALADPKNNATEGERKNAIALIAKLREQLPKAPIIKPTPARKPMSWSEMVAAARQANRNITPEASDIYNGTSSTYDLGDIVYWKPRNDTNSKI
jgi:hypothetical protein